MSDTPTVVAIAAIAYILATALHEHGGHALACIALGGRVRDLNAFYVDCDYRTMSDLAIRFVALAGPLMSLLTGGVAYFFARRNIAGNPQLQVWLWLLSTIGLMVASGYLLFSGFSGLGDFGFSRDGVLYTFTPEWLWRIVLIGLGILGYALAIRTSLSMMGDFIGGSGPARVAHAQRLSLTSYITGGLVSVIIGLFNPQGIVIVLLSAAAASLGGTSGLAWQTQCMARDHPLTHPPLQIARRWSWIIAGVSITLLYGLILGPSLKF